MFLSLGVKHKEPLGDALVDYDEGHFGFLAQFVKHLGKRIRELSHFGSDNLVALGVSHTVAKDNVVSRLLAFVVLLENSDRILNSIRHISRNELLPLFLEEDVVAVLAHAWVVGRAEADDGLASRVAHIDTDQHSPFFVHSLRELQSEEVAAELAVHLRKDLACFRIVELLSVAKPDDLGRQSVREHQILKSSVVVFIGQKTHDKMRGPALHVVL